MFKPKRELKIGDRVVVLNARFMLHDGINDDKKRFVGQTFTVREVADFDTLQTRLIMVRLEGNNYNWSRKQLAYVGKS